MGYAIQRADGSFRGWLGSQPMHPLQPGERIIEVEAPRAITAEAIAPDPAISKVLAIDATKATTADLPAIVEALQQIVR